MTTVLAAGRPGAGGPSVTLREASGRTQQVAFGPAPGGPVVTVPTCSRAECHQYEEHDPPSEFVPFAVGETVPIKIVQSGPRLAFYVRDRIVAQGPVDGTPLVDSSFDLYGYREAWTVGIDSVTVRTRLRAQGRCASSQAMRSATTSSRLVSLNIS